MSLLPLTVVWVLLALVLAGLVLYRSILARQEDDVPHISEPQAEIAASHQIAMAKKLGTVERWVKILTISIVVYGLVLFVIFGYNAWMESSRLSG